MQTSKAPKVSILVPIYGVEKYIERCARSLFEQTYDNIEYIFIDDCSKDRSAELLCSVINSYPTRKEQIIIVKHEINKGLGQSRNTGVMNSSGDFILHVDSDDYIEKDTVAKCVEEQTKTDADIVLFDAIIHYGNYSIKQCRSTSSGDAKLDLSLLARNNIVSVWGMMIRRRLYIDNKICVSDGVNNSEDYNVTPILAYFSRKNTYLKEFLYHYDCTNQSSYSYSFSENKADQVWQTIAKLETFFDDKGSVYINAVKQAKIKIACKDLIDSAKNRCNKDYYFKTKLRLSKIDTTDLSFVPLLYRYCFFMPSYNTLSIYVKIAEIVNGLLKSRGSNTLVQMLKKIMMGGVESLH